MNDAVRFKNPKRKPVYGVVSHIETDPDKVTWTRNGTIPHFITVKIETQTATGKLITSAKTYETKLLKR